MAISRFQGEFRCRLLRDVEIFFTMEENQPMKSIHVVVDKKLLEAVDCAARRHKQNRSALVRDALRGYLGQLNVRCLEERDRAGYATRPAAGAETSLWEVEAAWP